MHRYYTEVYHIPSLCWKTGFVSKWKNSILYAYPKNPITRQGREVYSLDIVLKTPKDNLPIIEDIKKSLHEFYRESPMKAHPHYIDKKNDNIYFHGDSYTGFCSKVTMEYSSSKGINPEVFSLLYAVHTREHPPEPATWGNFGFVAFGVEGRATETLFNKFESDEEAYKNANEIEDIKTIDDKKAYELIHPSNQAKCKNCNDYYRELAHPLKHISTTTLPDNPKNWHLHGSLYKKVGGNIASVFRFIFKNIGDWMGNSGKSN